MASPLHLSHSPSPQPVLSVTFFLLGSKRKKTPIADAAKKKKITRKKFCGGWFLWCGGNVEKWFRVGVTHQKDRDLVICVCVIFLVGCETKFFSGKPRHLINRAIPRCFFTTYDPRPSWEPTPCLGGLRKARIRRRES